MSDGVSDDEDNFHDAQDAHESNPPQPISNPNANTSTTSTTASKDVVHGNQPMSESGSSSAHSTPQMEMELLSDHAASGNPHASSQSQQDSHASKQENSSEDEPGTPSHVEVHASTDDSEHPYQHHLRGDNSKSNDSLSTSPDQLIKQQSSEQHRQNSYDHPLYSTTTEESSQTTACCPLFGPKKAKAQSSTSPSHAAGGIPMLSLGEGVAVRTFSNKKHAQRDFENVCCVQSVSAHAGAIWICKFSHSGKYLATGGQDGIVRVWKVHRGGLSDSKAVSTPDTGDWETKSTLSSSSASTARFGLGGTTPVSGSGAAASSASSSAAGGSSLEKGALMTAASMKNMLLRPTCLRSYAGHAADIFSLDWSPSNFLLSASMDKTVRLWHVSREQCLWVFKHADFVTGVAFHPLNEKMFFSVSLDEKLRLWNIPDKAVVHWLDTKSMLTSLSVVATGTQMQHGASPLLISTGSFEGTWSLFVCKEDKDSFGFRNVTRIDVVRSSQKAKWWERLKSAKKEESATVEKSRSKVDQKSVPKVTGFCVYPDSQQILVSTNDSRIRMFNLNDYSCACKYRGHVNKRAQLHASFSQSGAYVVSGSEDGKVYLWTTQPHSSSGRKDLNKEYEAFVATGSGDGGEDVPVTNALFVPFRSDNPRQAWIVTTDVKGELRVFENRTGIPAASSGASSVSGSGTASTS
jgi:WD40 repeat protein